MIRVHEIPGIENPADLMTKILTVGEIGDRLRGMNIQMYKEGELSCVYTYMYPIRDPLEICSVSVQIEDQALGKRDLVHFESRDLMLGSNGEGKDQGAYKKEGSRNKTKSGRFAPTVTGMAI